MCPQGDPEVGVAPGRVAWRGLLLRPCRSRLWTIKVARCWGSARSPVEPQYSEGAPTECDLTFGWEAGCSRGVAGEVGEIPQSGAVTSGLRAWGKVTCKTAAGAHDAYCQECAGGEGRAGTR